MRWDSFVGRVTYFRRNPASRQVVDGRSFLLRGTRRATNKALAYPVILCPASRRRNPDGFQYHSQIVVRPERALEIFVLDRARGFGLTDVHAVRAYGPEHGVTRS
jgi:hypothetical protein